MAIKTIMKYRFRERVLIPVIWMLLDQNPSDEEEN